MKKIIFWVQQYEPTNEAISKEVRDISNYLKKTKKYKVTIHDLHFKLNIRTNNLISYNFFLYPFIIPFINKFSKKYDISHIFTSLGDLPYLTVLKKYKNQKIILTAAANSNLSKIKKRLKRLRVLDHIIVESQKQKKILLKLGIDKSKVDIIYPGIDLTKYSYKKPKNKKFTILFASSPPKKDKFDVRGVTLLLELAKKRRDIELRLLWRNKGYKKIKRMISKKNLKNIILINKRIMDMNKEYAKVECSIIPYKYFDNFNKLIPNSAIESIAAGKPVIISTKTEIKDIIQKEKCGVIFEPNIISLISAINIMEKDYNEYQLKCINVAKKYFDIKKVIKKYKLIYDKN